MEASTADGELAQGGLVGSGSGSDLCQLASAEHPQHEHGAVMDLSQQKQKRQEGGGGVARSAGGERGGKRGISAAMNRRTEGSGQWSGWYGSSSGEAREGKWPWSMVGKGEVGLRRVESNAVRACCIGFSHVGRTQ